MTPWLRALADQDRHAWRLLVGSPRTAYDRVLGEAWGTIRSAFDAERTWLLAEEGIRAALAGLAPGPGWRGTTLAFDWPEDAVFELDGRGLVLLPTTVWSGWPMPAPRPGLPSVLVYPELSPLPLLGEGPSAEPLAALLGSTRGAALALLTRQRTTTDLGRAVHRQVLGFRARQGAAGGPADHHRTRRQGRLHSCTPLGLDLLAGTSGPGHRVPRPGGGLEQHDPRSRGSLYRPAPQRTAGGCRPGAERGAVTLPLHCVAGGAGGGTRRSAGTAPPAQGRVTAGARGSCARSTGRRCV
ncbi:hypothetical protein HUT19_02285 [Streptomyces sp. NA02950]|uniref:hypothetical protein n=1 Tax=Streptomyces sp. NA02950 TaxID=2742137 RepID=UPI001591287E|nr:hypothetical protein [Streptomyces sp. NA02950]QKV90723.1 hypothetical protein HUT19_02285 [Streptomyces sp. NA02950]